MLIWGILFLFITGIFGARLVYLQIEKGDMYLKRSRTTSWKKPLFLPVGDNL